MRRGAPALPSLAIALAPAGERERTQGGPGALALVLEREREGGARRAEREGEAETAGRERVEPGLSRWPHLLPGLPDLLSDEEWRVRLLPVQPGHLLRRLHHLLYATVWLCKVGLLSSTLHTVQYYTSVLLQRKPLLVITIFNKIIQKFILVEY